MRPLIELINVSKTYGDQQALKPTSLKFENGQTTALIGPSGCGKSTLLRLIVGLIDATSGEIKHNGQPLTKANAADLRKQMGYVIQDGGLFPHLTAAQNVTLMARYLGESKAEMDQRTQELCTLVQLSPDLLSRFPAELSGGQRQRVSLMRALMLQPQALLLDEPLGALDPMVRASLQTDLKEIFAKVGQTVVFVTHDMGEAAYLADVIVLLKDGAIVQQGTLEDFQKRPATPFVSEFLSAQRSVVAV